MIEPIDVRDLLGRPGASKRHRSAVARRRTSAPSSRGFATTFPSRSTCCWRRWSRASWSRARCGARCRCGARGASTEFEQPLAVDVHEMFVPEPDDDTDDYPLDPTARSSPTR